MCDETDLAAFRVTRRAFAASSAAAGLAACTPVRDSASAAGAGSLTEAKVDIPTADGTMDAFFVHPASGRHPAVIIWPDIAGLRPAFEAMARRLAGEGYAVLVANPYYRDGRAPQFADFADFMAHAGFAKTGPWRKKFTPEALAGDARALVAWLDAQGAVDRQRGIGTQGYCMGGPFTVATAAAVPARVKAAASFHGGGLVTDKPESPHLQIKATQASFLFAIAQNDDAKQPEAKAALREAAAAAVRPAEIEVYPADHGWSVPDSPVYDRDQAEKAWTRLLALYKRAL
ncbi:MAG: dienelactone hydrolase family protein [Tsuneonella sp.]